MSVLPLCLDLLTDDLDGVGMVLSYQFVDPPAGEETPFQHDPDTIANHLDVMQNVRAEKTVLPLIPKT